MFTDFVAECRAAKLEINLNARDPMGSSFVDTTLREASQPIAVAA